MQNGYIALTSCHYLVLDEADRMLGLFLVFLVIFLLNIKIWGLSPKFVKLLKLQICQLKENELQV